MSHPKRQNRDIEYIVVPNMPERLEYDKAQVMIKES